MTETRTVIRVFVASPNDVVEERKALEGVLRELNTTLAKDLGLYIELVSWETDSLPGVSTDPQAVINEQIGDDFDVFLGIMWTRFGTPTDRAGSGTEEEFDRAYKRWKKDPDALRVMFYFKNAPISPSDVEIDQLANVLAFKEKLSEEKGVYFWSFSSTTEFEQFARMHLAKQMRNWAGTDMSNANSRSVSEEADKLESAYVEAIVYYDEDEGFLDLIENGLEEADRGREALGRMSDAQTDLTTRVKKRTSEFEAVEKDDPASLKIYKRISNSTAQDMEEFVARMESEVPIFSGGFSSFIESFGKAALIVPDFKDSEETQKNLSEALDALSALLPTISETTEQMEGFRDTISDLPRITTRFNRAKRSTVSVTQSLIAELESTYYLAVEAEETLRRVVEQSSQP